VFNQNSKIDILSCGVRSQRLITSERLRKSGVVYVLNGQAKYATEKHKNTLIPYIVVVIVIY